MATPYSAFYNIFLGKVTDYDILAFEDTDRNAILKGLLKSACVQFSKICRQNLEDRDDATETFAETIDDDAIEIVTELMISEWLKSKLYLSESFKNAMNTKDFNQFSPANLLKEIRETYNLTKFNAKKLMIDYSYRGE